MSLGNGLGRIEDRVFRIGHMGDLGVLQLDRARLPAWSWGCAWPASRTRPVAHRRLWKASPGLRGMPRTKGRTPSVA